MSDYEHYESLKADWVRSHPDASNDEYEEAMAAFAEACGL